MDITNTIWELIVIIFTDPISIVILLALSITIHIMYPKFRGYMGEFWVKQELKQLPKKEYIVLNDIMLELNNTTHQIDHIIVSKYGIFVIEMKNYYGVIFGDEYRNKWLQKLKKNKYYFKNPIHQNYGHIKTLEELLNLDEKLFISIICFSNQTKLKITSKSDVVQLDDLISVIKKYQEIKLEKNINEISNKIKKLNIKNKTKRKKHTKTIKTKLKEDDIKVKNMICPKCGNKLIKRTGKYGSFIGCSNYPNCKFTKQ